MGGIVSFLVSDEVWFCFPIEYWYFLDSISKWISNQYEKFSLVSGLLLDWGEHRPCRGNEREAVILFKMLLKMVLNINLYIVATIINISLYIVGTITEWKVEDKDGRAVEAVRRLACPAQCASGQPQVAASNIVILVIDFLWSSSRTTIGCCVLSTCFFIQL